MSGVGRMYRNWRYRRKCARVGKGCTFLGNRIEMEGRLEFGHYCRVREGARLRAYKEGRIVFGDRCLVSWNAIIESGQSIEIHDHVGVGENAVVRDGNHLIYGTDAVWRYTPYIYKPVVLCEGAWIGSGAYISLGVTVGKGAVIGAGSVVPQGRTIGEYEIWGGVPARFIRHRLKDLPPELEAEAARLLAEQPLREDRREW